MTVWLVVVIVLMLLLTGTKREQQKMTDKEENDKYTTFYLPSSAKNLFLSCADFLCHCLLVVVHTGEKKSCFHCRK